MLPDDALIAIFDICVYQHSEQKKDIEAWQTLVHVCRRWRTVVFASPRRLNLRLVCPLKTPARDTLDIWPALPLVIRHGYGYPTYPPMRNIDNVIAVLERSNRVCQIYLSQVSSSDLEKISVAMQVPFPELTDLQLESFDETDPVLPDSFLGGSASRLRSISFGGIPLPGLPKLLSSATHLADLTLIGIPHSGYFSPEAMITALPTLTSLRSLSLGFTSPRSCPDQASRRPPLQPRSVLPVLTMFWFKGVTEYLEDFVACIDAPRLGRFDINFFNDIVFDTPQLIQFIGRTPTLLNALDSADVIFGSPDSGASVRFSSKHLERIDVNILCSGLDWQVSSAEQVCTSCLPFIFTLETLFIVEEGRPEREDNVENTQWLELLHPFAAVKRLYLSEEIAPRIARALQELDGGRTTEVLPALQNIHLDLYNPVGEGIRQFVATRQVAGHSIEVRPWTGWPNREHNRRRLV